MTSIKYLSKKSSIFMFSTFLLHNYPIKNAPFIGESMIIERIGRLISPDIPSSHSSSSYTNMLCRPVYVKQCIDQTPVIHTLHCETA